VNVSGIPIPEDYQLLMERNSATAPSQNSVALMMPINSR
jgi:hypothetical protein